MRDHTLTLLKALAMLLVVLAHASSPMLLARLAYLINVPVFFVFAGYVFNEHHLENKMQFLRSRIKRLYFPFVRWSIFFLLLHNLLFPLGLLSEQYGNAAGGVTHPYTWQQLAQNLWSIVFNMSGYDPFLAGSFWFFRALLLSSLGFFFLLFLARGLCWLRNGLMQAGSILLLMLLLAIWLCIDQLKVTGLAQGGYRELMGVAFLAVGFLLRASEVRWPKLPLTHPLFGLGVGIVVLLPLMLWMPVSMAPRPASVGSIFALVVAGTAGFLFLRALSRYLLLLPQKYLRPLLYLGENTIYVFAFHLFAFKLVSALKVAIYGLPWEMVGGHPVVQHAKDDFSWLVYALCGIALPLLWVWNWRRLCTRYQLKTDTPLDWLRVCLRLSIVFYLQIVAFVRFIGRILVAVGRAFWNSIKAILAASNPREEE